MWTVAKDHSFSFSYVFMPRFAGVVASVIVVAAVDAAAADAVEKTTLVQFPFIQLYLLPACEFIFVLLITASRCFRLGSKTVYAFARLFLFEDFKNKSDSFCTPGEMWRL